MNRVLIGVGGAATFAGSIGVGLLVGGASKKPAGGVVQAELPGQEARLKTYGELAKTYDSKIGWDEMAMGLLLLRRWLIGTHAEGSVLEVAAGTGRNLSYYSPSRCTSLTLTDGSAEMLGQVRDSPALKAVSSGSGPNVDLVQAEAERLTQAPELREGQFDTVVDTFGLCSFEDPVEALRQMQRCCKPGGKVLLLEHGRSASWQWLSDILDRDAPAHAAKWGCIWNRDIAAIAKESGLAIEYMSTWHFGTTYYIVGRPCESAGAATTVATSPTASGLEGGLEGPRRAAHRPCSCSGCHAGGR